MISVSQQQKTKKKQTKNKFATEEVCAHSDVI
jgi:hypothetical protein